MTLILPPTNLINKLLLHFIALSVMIMKFYLPFPRTFHFQGCYQNKHISCITEAQWELPSPKVPSVDGYLCAGILRSLGCVLPCVNCFSYFPPHRNFRESSELQAVSCPHTHRARPPPHPMPLSVPGSPRMGPPTDSHCWGPGCCLPNPSSQSSTWHCLGCTCSVPIPFQLHSSCRIS